MRVMLFQPRRPGTALQKELDLDFVPFPGLIIQGANPLRYSSKVKEVRFDLPTGMLVADMDGRVDEATAEYLAQEGWHLV